MGLRLYTPPVESDVRVKRESERSPAHARSTIRRNRISRHSENSSNRSSTLPRPPIGGSRDFYERESARWRREFSRQRVGSAGPPPLAALPPVPPSPSAENRSRRDRPDILFGGQLAAVDDELNARLEARWALLDSAQGLPSTSRERDSTPSTWALRGDIDGAMPRLMVAPDGPYATSSLRTTQAPRQANGRRAGGNRRSYLRHMHGHSHHVPEVTFAELTDDISSRPRSPNGLSERRTIPTPPPGTTARNPLPEFLVRLEDERVDGLGDRNRSLSPEGDNVWDTLLTTLTPDPQPPSVGSSFASASASASAAATSQSTAAGSSGTSLTGPDIIDELTFEHPCESGRENSDTDGPEGEDGEEEEEEEEDEDDGDEDDDLDGDELARDMVRWLPSLRGGRRSYADVAAGSGTTSRDDGNASGNDDFLQFLDMRRIVRHLARREDIPDEWWAEAGLSRTLSRETSS